MAENKMINSKESPRADEQTLTQCGTTWVAVNDPVPRDQK